MSAAGRETADDVVLRLLRGKSGWERVCIASNLFDFARELVIQSIRAAHPEWSAAQVQAETLRRIQGDAVATAAARPRRTLNASRSD
jgi:Rv0078B-related antitoxin